MNKNVLIEKAKKVLGNNWTGGFTKPSPKLYPHQWNWDSGFISIGYSHFDQKTEVLEDFIVLKRLNKM